MLTEKQKNIMFAGQKLVFLLRHSGSRNSRQLRQKLGQQKLAQQLAAMFSLVFGPRALTCSTAPAAKRAIEEVGIEADRKRAAPAPGGAKP